MHRSQRNCCVLFLVRKEISLSKENIDFAERSALASHFNVVFYKILAGKALQPLNYFSNIIFVIKSFSPFPLAGEYSLP